MINYVEHIILTLHKINEDIYRRMMISKDILTRRRIRGIRISLLA